MLLYTDCPEGAAEFLASPPVAAALAACAPALRLLHITDRRASPEGTTGHPAVIRVSALVGKGPDDAA
jgi:hypothetical protein